MLQQTCRASFWRVKLSFLSSAWTLSVVKIIWALWTLKREHQLKDFLSFCLPCLCSGDGIYVFLLGCKKKIKKYRWRYYRPERPLHATEITQNSFYKNVHKKHPPKKRIKKESLQKDISTAEYDRPSPTLPTNVDAGIDVTCLTIEGSQIFRNGKKTSDRLLALPTYLVTTPRKKSKTKKFPRCNWSNFFVRRAE